MLLKLNYHGLLSSFGFNFNLRRYNEVEATNLGLLDCAVRAAAAGAVDGGGDVSLRRERVMPFRSSGSLVSYTVHMQPPLGKTAASGTASEVGPGEKVLKMSFNA
jgi:hypothetical protein